MANKMREDEVNSNTGQNDINDGDQENDARAQFDNQEGQARMRMIEPDQEEIVQVVYQSNNSGSLVGVESNLISAPGAYELGQFVTINSSETFDARMDENDALNGQHQQIARAASTLPSVAEESSSGAGANHNHDETIRGSIDAQCLEERTSRSISQANEEFASDEREQRPDYPADLIHDSSSCCVIPQCTDLLGLDDIGADLNSNSSAIYSTVNKQTKTDTKLIAENSNYDQSVYNESLLNEQHVSKEAYNYNVDPIQSVYSNEEGQPIDRREMNGNFAGMRGSVVVQNEQIDADDEKNEQSENEKKEIEEINAEICQIISRQKQGAAESGSLKNNFKKKKKLVVSISTNENDLTAHRQKLLDSKEDANDANDDEETLGSLPKFKRTHSVSFNVGSSRGGRHSVDIRNLPSYLTVKRASIVDVAKGAMSSLMHSFGSGGGGGGTGSSISNSRRDSAQDDEPIFEEPIAPTLSLGQRVALVKNNGAEFGTVGWIGQLPDVDDDWVVGVIFDNMIGNCDGAHDGIRYFYSRENYAMFVPLSVLTKTDNYIGRPETGTMLSRMSVSLKPGQLISIQRSSIRLQHCFLNAPHQRVGHDVRAVSNRLHCQCHNCGPCAHLTKQHSRVSAIPAFGAHHAANKKNSLAHAAVEILAHHHHHYHEEEHHEEEDYQFGDNAAHACNFVRYSCCQQNGATGHEFSTDCGLVRPELLDNLIHAPRAPHRRSRPRRVRKPQAISCSTNNNGSMQAIALAEGSSAIEQVAVAGDLINEASQSSYSSCSSRSSSKGPQDGHYGQANTNSHQMDSMNYLQDSAVYNTIDSKMSLHDQQRFIYQRESSTSVYSRQQVDHNDDAQSNIGLIPRLRRCFGCLRKGETKRRRPKKRKLSARNRLIEYRRKQSTFVPSTLAKPQDDFASHGIVMPSWQPSRQDNNSDYSSYSKSSESSPSNSPRRFDYNQSNYVTQQQQQQQFISIEHEIGVSNEPLKSSHTLNLNASVLNYDDYTFSDGYGSYEKNAYSRESDLGYFDTTTNCSNDTLKNIIDQAINEEESVIQLAPDLIEAVSPIQSNTVSDSCDQVNVSSPTISMSDQDGNELCARIEGLDLDRESNSR